MEHKDESFRKCVFCSDRRVGKCLECFCEYKRIRKIKELKSCPKGLW